jgi:phosphoribosylaminoimidazolecarboxamide formyltransferase/IMP cyclohydrolase
MALHRVGTIDDRVPVRTVLASVSDKTGLDALVHGLLSAAPGLAILSTGGTHGAIGSILGARAAGVLRQVSDYTGQPEMEGGLVKTLDFRIYLGLLSETHNPAHRADLARTHAVAIDMVVANLYPFAATVSKTGATFEDGRGHVDIGGPCMVRAAAKNFHRVAVLTDPADYADVVGEMARSGGSLGLDTRLRLAQKAFRLTATYDAAIAEWMSRQAAAAVRADYDVRARAAT